MGWEDHDDFERMTDALADRADMQRKRERENPCGNQIEDLSLGTIRCDKEHGHGGLHRYRIPGAGIETLWGQA